MANRRIYDMIETYKTYNESIQINKSVVGYPSGEYFDLTSSQFNKLNLAGLIHYDRQFRFFYFNDKDYYKVLDTINSVNKKKMIIEFLERNNITNYKINEDYTVDVIQNVKIIEKFRQLPIDFDFVLGDFDISDCGLETLKGCPERVGDNFICINNNLEDLTGGPRIVDGCYNVRRCGLKSLTGSPININDDFNAGENELQTLHGGPKKVDGNYYCDNCLLLSLQGCAETITGNFDCSYNFLIDLTGGPQEIYGVYDCSSNQLKSNKGAPQKTTVFKCTNNKNMPLVGLLSYKKIIT